MPMQRLERLAFLAVALLAADVAAAGPEFVVAQDGSGDFRTIMAAIDAMKAFPPERITIHLRKGTYREKVVVPEWNTRLTIVGESAAETIIRFDDYFDGIDRGRNRVLIPGLLTNQVLLAPLRG